MENKIYVEMTFEELKAYNDFKENDISTEEIVKLLMNRCTTLKEEAGISPTMEKYVSNFGTICLEDGSNLYFSYTKRMKGNKQ